MNNNSKRIICCGGSVGIGKTTWLNNKKHTNEFEVNSPVVKETMEKTYKNLNITLEEQREIIRNKQEQFEEYCNIPNFDKLLDRGPLDPIVFGIIYFDFTNERTNMIQMLHQAYLLKFNQVIKDRAEYYIFTSSWRKNKKRILKRGRPEEINFKLLKKLNKEFPFYLKKICTLIGVPWKIIKL